jgi:hypothetical protein
VKVDLKWGFQQIDNLLSPTNQETTATEKIVATHSSQEEVYSMLHQAAGGGIRDSQEAEGVSGKLRPLL